MFQRGTAIITCLCLTTVTACTTTVKVTPGSYAEMETSSGESYRIETTDGRVYVTDQLTRADGVFVVHTCA